MVSVYTAEDTIEEITPEGPGVEADGNAAWVPPCWGHTCTPTTTISIK